MAADGAQRQEGKTPQQALQYLGELITEHVKVQDKGAREALQNFVGGTGDVLISYENEAIKAQDEGEDVDYVIPPSTILIQTPIAVTSDSSHAAAAQAFVNWLLTPAAQTIWAKHGYRPVLPSVMAAFASKFPTPPDLFTIDSLGGWTAVAKKFFAPSTGLVTQIEAAAGVPTASS